MANRTLRVALTLELPLTRLLSRRRSTVSLAVEVDRMRIRGFKNGAKVLRTRVEMRAPGKSKMLLVLADMSCKYNDLNKNLFNLLYSF